MVDIFPDNEIFAKSAKLASIEANADHPPLPSISESLSSLNQTSPLNTSPLVCEGFFKPIIIFLIEPIVGFPLIAYLYFLSPGRPEILENSVIGSKSSSKYNTSERLF